MRKFITDILVKASLGVEQNAYVLGTVGIGTISPAAKLHVEGTIYSPTYTSGGITINSGDFLFSAEGGGDGFQMDYYNGQMYLGNNAGTSWHMVMQDNGNIGIGTTSPTDKLQVVASTYNGITITTPDVATFKMRSTSGTTSWGFATTNLAANDFGIYQSNSGGGDPINAGTARLYFNGSGNVGIGTTAPISKLQVNGQFRQLYSRAFISNPLDSDGYAGHIIVNSNNANGDLAGIGLYTNSSYNAAAGLFALQESSTAASMVFYAGSNLATERMRITAGGNVGIGTASTVVNSLLNVAGGVNTTTGIIGYDTSDAFTFNGKTQPHYGFNLNPTGSSPIGISGYFGINFATNGTERLRIDYVGNVGIGTASPAYKLDVSVASQHVARFTSTTADNGGLIINKSNASYNPNILLQTGGNTKWYILNASNDSDKFQLYESTGTNPRFTLTQAGNIGVGTTSPVGKLSILVDGASTWSQYIQTPLTGNKRNSIGFHDYTGSNIAAILTDVNANNTADFGISVPNGSPRLVITSSGNVGIGTTSPYGRLELNGSGQTWPTAPAIRMWDSFNSKGWLVGSANNYTAGDFYIRTLPSVSGDPGAGQQEFTIKHATGNVGIGTTSPGAKLHVSQGASGNSLPSNAQAVFEYDANGGIAVSTPTGNAAGVYFPYSTSPYYAGIDRFETNLRFFSGDSERMRINASGNVGIGTTSPLSKVHIEDSSPILTIKGVGNGEFGLKITDGSANTGGITYNSNTGEQRIIGGQSYVFQTIYSGGSERMRITTGGNVGIGTTSPADKLQVQNGNLSLYSNSYGNTGLVRHFGTDSLEKYQQGLTTGGDFYQYTFSGLNHIFYTNNGFERMRITSGGNVGIGTTSPGSKLHVYSGSSGGTPYTEGITAESNSRVALNLLSGAANDSYVFFGNSSAGNAGYIGYENTANRLVLRSSDYVSLLDSTGEVIRIDGGNVGIGTTSPTLVNFGRELVISQITGGQPEAFLAIQGNRTDDNNIGGVNFYNNSNFLASVAARRTGADNSGALTFNTSNSGTGSEKMRITSGGNVLIGTTTDVGSKLYVDGTIRTSGALVSGGLLEFTGGWSASPYNPSSWIRAASGVGLFLVNNSISKWAGFNSTSDFIVNSGDIYVSSSSGNVGIGTTSPSEKLAVAGRITLSGSEFSFSGDEDKNITVFSNRLLNLRTNDITRLTITGSGNVGIGTASPGYALDVIARASGEGGVRFWNNRAASSTVDSVAIHLNVSNTVGMTGGKIVVAENTNDAWPTNMQFYINSAGSSYSPVEAMRITSAGNVGIGTTSPSALFHVSQASAATVLRIGNNSNYDQSILFNGGNDWSLGMDYSNSNAFVLSNYSSLGTNDRLVVTTGGNVGIGTASPTEKLHIVGSNALQIIQSTTAGQNSTLKFITTARTWGIGANMGLSNSNLEIYDYTASANRLTIDSSGNVGIGTTAPSAKLEVADFGGATIKISNKTDGGQTTGDLVGALDYYSYDADYPRTMAYVRSYVTEQFGRAADLRFATTATNAVAAEAMRITSAGNVGIGTTSPSAKLEVAGNIKGQGLYYNGSTGGELRLDNSYGGGIGYYADEIGHNFYTWISGVGWVNKMAITDAGNVGIGTTSPVSISGYTSLDINNATNGGLIQLSRAGVGFGQLYNNASEVQLRSIAAVPLVFGTNSSEKMRITSAGNVGIGTTSPGQKLTLINGTFQIGGTSTFSDNVEIGRVGSDNNMAFATGGTERMRITAGGNVGIGTTSPASKLEVRGTVTFFGDSSFQPGNLTLTDVTSGGSSWSIYSGFPSLGDFTIRESGVANHLTIKKTSGNFGIGTTSPSYKLHVEGNTSGISIYASHDIAAFSDITVKKEVKRIENAIEKVKELNGYTYVRTDDETGTRRAGVIAQEVQKVLPEVVSANPDGTLNVAYSNMIALLIEGMKEQQKEIDELKKLLKK
jgi:hypothetical protein